MLECKLEAHRHAINATAEGYETLPNERLKKQTLFRLVCGHFCFDTREVLLGDQRRALVITQKLRSYSPLRQTFCPGVPGEQTPLRTN